MKKELHLFGYLISLSLDKSKENKVFDSNKLKEHRYKGSVQYLKHLSNDGGYVKKNTVVELKTNYDYSGKIYFGEVRMIYETDNHCNGILRWSRYSNSDILDVKKVCEKELDELNNLEFHDIDIIIEKTNHVWGIGKISDIINKGEIND